MRRTAAFRPRRLARSLAPVAALALVSALAAGCSDDGDSDADDNEDSAEDTVEVGPFSADQITQAVLQPDNLGEGWTSEPATDDDEEAPGCLADVDTLTEGLAEKDKGGTSFSYPEALTVESTVSAYAEEIGVAAVFDQVQTALAACSLIEGPDSDGNIWDVDLTVSDEAVYDDVDDQYGISGAGTLTTSDGTAYDIYIEQTAVRLGPNVATVTTTDLQSRTTEHAVWTEIAVERLLDVAEGEEPEATTAPAPA